MSNAEQINSLLDYDSKVELRVTLAARRRELLANWQNAQAAASVFGTEFWAERILAVNDAQRALGLYGL